MRYLTTVFLLLFTAIAYGNEVVSTMLSKAAEKAEQKAELAVNDMFNNIEIDLSGFYKGKPSYGISTILPLYETNNLNNFFAIGAAALLPDPPCSTRIDIAYLGFL